MGKIPHFSSKTMLRNNKILSFQLKEEEIPVILFRSIDSNESTLIFLKNH
jgi:hypothetical protein